MRTVTHPEHQDDYNKGFARGRETSEKFGKNFAIKQFNLHCPKRIASLSDYYYFDGYMEGLL